MIRYLYTFTHRARYVEIGPCESLDEALDAFQAQFGYWPENDALFSIAPYGDPC